MPRVVGGEPREVPAAGDLDDRVRRRASERLLRREVDPERTPAPAEDQDDRWLAGPRSRSASSREALKISALVGIPTHTAFLSRRVGSGERRQSLCREAAGEAIDAPWDGVLLVQERRHAERPCRDHGRRARVAPDPENGSGRRSLYYASTVDDGF